MSRLRSCLGWLFLGDWGGSITDDTSAELVTSMLQVQSYIVETLIGGVKRITSGICGTSADGICPSGQIDFPKPIDVMAPSGKDKGS